MGEDDTPVLSPRLTILVEVSAGVASRDEERLREIFERAAEWSAAAGAEFVDAMEEALVQTFLFLGYPAALNALAVWREVGPPAPRPREADVSTWTARGEEVCRRVYGTQYDGLRGNIAALHPDLDRWMVDEGYGRVLGRPGLPLVERELCIVGILTVLGTSRQLYAHLRGALRVGASPEEVAAAVGLALRYASADVEDIARRTLEDVVSRHREAHTDDSNGGAPERGSRDVH